MNSSNFKSSRVRIVMLASLVVSLLYLTGCCNQQQGQAADGGRRDTKGIVAADKPKELPAQPQIEDANGTGQTVANPAGNETAAEGNQAEDDKNETTVKTDVVNNIPGEVNPAGAGLTPGEGATEGKIDDSNRVQPVEGENTPKLEEVKEEEKIVEVSTDDL